MKKAMSLLTATAMAATLLAGCGGGAASSSAAPAADSTSTEASSTAAEPAADVEYMGVVSQFQALTEFEGGLAAANVEFVDAREIGGGQVGRILACREQGVPDPRRQPFGAAAIM